jgi:cobaltochelatase CobS
MNQLALEATSEVCAYVHPIAGLEKVLVYSEVSAAEAFGLPGLSPDLTVNRLDIPPPESFDDPELAYWADFLRKQIPVRNPFYKFRVQLVEILCIWLNSGLDLKDVLYLWGRTGSGKTSVVEQFFAVLGYPLFTGKGHARFEPEEAFGQFILNGDSGTEWVDGAFTMAARLGLPYLLNEADRIKPGIFIVFNDAFEGRSFCLPGKPGDVVKPAPGFCIIMTGNTNMVENTNGAYQMSQMDFSLLDRLLAYRVDYSPSEIEENIVLGILATVPDQAVHYFLDQQGLSVKVDAGLVSGKAITRPMLAAAFVEVADSIRKQSMDGDNENAHDAIERTMSTRTLIRFVRYSLNLAFLSQDATKSAVHRALDLVLGLGSDQTRVVIHLAVEKVFHVGEVLVAPETQSA